MGTALEVRPVAVAAFLAQALLIISACAPPQPPLAATPQRIISLSPGITEVIFALGLGHRVVAVTRFCDYPPEAAALPKVGGYLDASFEAIVSLEPDLVVVMESHDEMKRRLNRLGMATLKVDQHDVETILQSITAIAAACGVPERAAPLRQGIRRDLDRVAAHSAGLDRPRVLVVVGREVGRGTVTSVWAAGTETYFNDLIELAGGTNAIDSALVQYPELSREGLLSLDPDVILDVVADLDLRELSSATAVADWHALQELRAVRSDRLHLIDHDFAGIPSPRVAATAELFARAIHPEAGWSP